MNQIHQLFFIVVVCSLSLVGCNSGSGPDSTNETFKPPSFEVYLELLRAKNPQPFLQAIEQKWHPGSATMLVELYRFARNTDIKSKMVEILRTKTGEDHGDNMSGWYEWIWNQPYEPHPDYAKFKSKLYSRIDARFSEYFDKTSGAKIRLDEIRWGGVKRDGIPPLKNPDMISPREADWLEDSNVVFGVVINGDAHCYPKRILGWHEMFKASIGGKSICGVY